MNLFKIGFLCFALLIASRALARELIFETYGDSLTAGFLANTNVADSHSLQEISTIITDLLQFALTKNRKYLKPHHDSQSAWPNLVAERLRASGTPVSIRDFAFSGAHTSDLAAEVKMAPETKDAVLAFFFVGSNDLCPNTSKVDISSVQFYDQYRKALEYWDSHHQNSDGYLISLADIWQVYEVLSNFRWYEGSDGTFRCEDSWTKLFPFCPAYAKLFREKRLRTYLEPRIRDMNEALASLTSYWNEATKNGNRYYHLHQSDQLVLKPEYFAIDCYHLSRKGQQYIADLVYGGVF